MLLVPDLQINCEITGTQPSTRAPQRPVCASKCIDQRCNFAQGTVSVSNCLYWAQTPSDCIFDGYYGYEEPASFCVDSAAKRLGVTRVQAYNSPVDWWPLPDDTVYTLILRYGQRFLENECTTDKLTATAWVMEGPTRTDCDANAVTDPQFAIQATGRTRCNGGACEPALLGFDFVRIGVETRENSKISGNNMTDAVLHDHTVVPGVTPLPAATSLGRDFPSRLKHLLIKVEGCDKALDLIEAKWEYQLGPHPFALSADFEPSGASQRFEEGFAALLLLFFIMWCR